MVEAFEPLAGKIDFIHSGDLETIPQPIDFLGINFYTRAVVKASDGFLNAQWVEGDGPKTDMGWEVAPYSLFDLLQRVETDYTRGLPNYITENGAAYPDSVVDGQVKDALRVRYLHDHFVEAKRFMDRGGALKGYYVWSFMDNFEWAFGYSKRFGITYVDYGTQQRIPKDSFRWLQRVIAANDVQWL